MALTMPAKTWEKGGSGNASTESSAKSIFNFTKDSPFYEVSVKIAQEKEAKKSEDEKRTKYEADEKRAKYYADNIKPFTDTYNDIANYSSNYFDSWRSENDSKHMQSLYTSLNDHFTKLRDSITDNSYLKDNLSEDEYIRLEREVNAIGESIGGALDSIKQTSDVYAQYKDADSYNKHLRLSGMNSDELQEQIDALDKKSDYMSKLDSSYDTIKVMGDDVRTPTQEYKDYLKQAEADRVEFTSYKNNAKYREDVEKYGVDPASMTYDEITEYLSNTGLARRKPDQYDFVKKYYDSQSNYDWQMKRSEEFVKSLGTVDYDWIKKAADAVDVVVSTASGNEVAEGARVLERAYEVLGQRNGWTTEETRDKIDLAKLYIDAEERAENKAKVAERMEKHPVMSPILENTLSVLTNIPGSIMSFGDSVSQAVTNKVLGNDLPVNTNTSAQSLLNYTNDVREETRKQIEKKTPESGKKVALLAYDTLMTIADVSAGSAIGGLSAAGKGLDHKALAKAIGRMSGTISSSSAAANKVQESIKNGDSNGVAIAKGAIVGAIEYLAERIPIDALVKGIVNGDTLYKTIIKGSLSEGTEEVVSNILAEDVMEKAFGNGTRFERLYDDYLAQGYKKERAFEKAILDVVGEDAETFLSAAIAGGVFGGMTAIETRANDKANTKMAQNAVANEIGGAGEISFLRGINYMMANAEENLNEASVKEAERLIEKRIENIEKAKESLAENQSLKRVVGEDGVKAEIDKANASENYLKEILGLIRDGSYDAPIQDYLITAREEAYNASAESTAMKEGKLRAAAEKYVNAVGSVKDAVSALKKTKTNIDTETTSLKAEKKTILESMRTGTADAKAKSRLREINTAIKNNTRDADRADKLSAEITKGYASYMNRALGNSTKDIGKALSGATGRDVRVEYDATMAENEAASVKTNGKVSTLRLNPVNILRAQAELEDSGANIARSKVVHEAGHIAARTDGTFVPKVYAIYSNLRDNGFIPSDIIDEETTRTEYRSTLDAFLKTNGAQAEKNALMNEKGLTEQEAVKLLEDRYMQEEYVMQFLEYMENNGANLYNTIVPEKRNAFVEAMHKIAQFFRDIAAKIRKTDPASAKKMETLADKLYNAVSSFAEGSTTAQERTNAKTTENTTDTKSMDSEGSTGTHTEDERKSLDIKSMSAESRTNVGEQVLDSEAAESMTNEEAFEDSEVAVRYSIRPPYSDGSKAFNEFAEGLSTEAKETFDLFYGFYQRSRITNALSVSGKKVKGVNISSLYLRAQEWNDMLRADEKWRASAKELADFLPKDIRERMRMNPDGTLNPNPLEEEFKMPSSLAQRLVDSLPYEMIDAEYKLGNKTITLPEGKARQSVGGEAYRRAIIDETRKLYADGKLKQVGIGTMSKDRWGSLGFLAANGKTGASGDFTTVCPQMMFNRGCWYCYRRAAMEKGVNNKLVANNVWYTGEILRIKDSDIKQLNENGGLRIQSFGDWMPHFSAMLADVLYDAEMRGLQVKIITKEPSMINYIAAIREQGIGKNLYFNLSADYTIEKATPGNGELDAVNPERPFQKNDEGFWWKRAMTVEEAAKYRDKYPWVNTRIVATDVNEFIRGLKDSRVDVVTGYHGNIREFERVDSTTGEHKVMVEALGDAGMPRFAYNPATNEWVSEYEGKTQTHKRLAEAIASEGLQMEYYTKTCCITGRCASCKGKCGALARDFNVKNATNRDEESVAYWRKEMQYAIEPEFGDMTESADNFDTDERKSLATGTSIYIKDGHTADGQTVDFVNLILDGKKKGETRSHKSLTRKWVGIAKDGYVYGRVRFGEPYLISKDSTEYADSYIEGTEYDIEDGEQKYYYPVLEIEDFRDDPKPITKHGNYAQYEYDDGVSGDDDVDSNGNALSVGQREFFKDSKVRDEDGKLKVMYHGTNTPNFTVFDPSFSDDKISLFFTDAPDVADSYTSVQSGGKNVNPYKLPNTIKTLEEYNNYMESIGSDTRLIKVTDEVISKATKDIEAIVSEDGRNRFYLDRIDELKSIKGKFIHYNGGVNYITRSEQVYDTAEEAIESDANDKYWTPHRFGNRYSVYLNLKNPYIIDAGKHARGVGNVSIMSGYDNATARFDVDGEEFFITKDYKESYEDFAKRFLSKPEVDKFLRVFTKAKEKSIREEMKLFDKTREEVLADWAKYGEQVDGFEYTGDNASIDYTESGHWKHLEFNGRTGTTRDVSKWAKENGYDGVIFENLRDIGGYSGGTVTRAATIAVAFDSNQVKSTLNENPTEDPDIRYSKDTSFTKDKYFDRQIDKWSELRENSFVKVGVIKSNSALHAVGIPTGGLYFDVSKMRTAMQSHDDHLTEDDLKGIPDLLNNPIVLTEYKPGTNSNTVSVYGNMFVNGVPVVVGVVMTRGRGGSIISKVRTVHARGTLKTQITDNSVLYLGENKKETNAWFQACGIDVPLGGTQLGVIRSIGFVDSVPQVEKNVNTSEEDSRSSIETDQAKKIARLKEDKEFLKRQMQSGRSVALSTSGKDSILRDMKKQYALDKSDMASVGKMLGAIDDVVNGKIKAERMEEVFGQLERDARTILENVYEVDSHLMRENEAFVKYIRSTPYSVPTDNESDFAGGYAEYRNENRKYVNLSRNGTPIDSVYAELCVQYPGMLDRDVDVPSDMIEEIVRVMKSLEPEDVPVYADTINQASSEFVNALIAKYMNTAQKTYAQKMREKADEIRKDNADRRVAAEVNRVQSEADRMEKSYQQKIESLNKSNEKLIQQTVTAYEARLNSIEYAAARDAKEYERIINRYRDIESAREFAGDRKEYARRIRQDARALRSAAVSPNSKKFVPEKYRGNVERIAEFMDHVSSGRVNLKSEIAEPWAGIARIREDFRSVSDMFSEDFEGLAMGILNQMEFYTSGLSQMENQDLKAAIFYRDAYKLGRLMRKSIAGMNKAVINGKNVNAANVGADITETLNHRRNTQKEFESLGDKKSGKIMNVVFNKNLSFTDARSFFHRMGKAGDNIYETLRDAQSRQYLYIKQYTDAVGEKLKDIDLSQYAGDKQKTVTITLSNGKEYTLTAAQAMNIVTLYERESGKSHIENGGVRIYNPKTRQASRATALTDKDIVSLRNALDETDKKVMRVLSDFMRNECTAWGNEATMEKYGFHRFTTKDYFPISVDRTATGADMKSYAPAQFNVENVGFAKPTKDNASAPVMIDSMIDVANNHIRGMASYAAYLNVEDGLNRIMKVPGVTDAMKRALGSDAQKYITEMMNDLKGAGKTEELASNTVEMLNKFAGRYKAAAVSYNTSTVAKQPLSYLRAAAVIDAKYLAKGVSGNHKVAYDEMMKHSGIAVRKEIGYSDVGVGKTIGEQIGYTERGTLKSGVRKFNEFGMAGAALADRVTWESIWLACKAEQTEKNASAAIYHDKLMQATAKRFADVVAQTQVVDSALDSAPVSRSNNPLVRLTYAFMSEPIKGYNLFVDALDDISNSPDQEAKKRAAKHLARVSAYTLIGWAAEAAITSAFSAIRDDDDEFVDKFSETYFGNLGQNAIGILPMADPIVDAFLEVFQGYTPSNMADQTLIDVASGMADAFKTIMDAEGKRETPVKAIRDAVESVATMLGVPVKNIARMVNNTAKSAFQITNAYKASYELQKIWYNPNNATAREKNGFNSILADAYLSGDREAFEYIYEDMRKMGLKPQQIVNSIAKDAYKDDIADTEKSTLVKYTPGSDAWYIGMKTIFNRDEKAPKATEDEITRVYKASGETSVLPKFKDGKYTVDGTSKEFEGDALDKYLEDYGNLYYEVANAMRDLAAYRKGSAEEQAWWLTKAEKYAAAVAVYKQDKDYSITSVGKWVTDYVDKKPSDVAKYIVGNLTKK